MSVTIERLRPLGGITEQPLHEQKGFKLADPERGDEMHHAKHTIHVGTLEKAADLVKRAGFSIWMVCKGKRASLISPASLRIIRR